MTEQRKKRRSSRSITSKKNSPNRKKENQVPNEIDLKFTHIREDLPPDEERKILLWDVYIGWDVEMSSTVRHHILHDFENLGYSRTVKWALLPGGSL